MNSPGPGLDFGSGSGGDSLVCEAVQGAEFIIIAVETPGGVVGISFPKGKAFEGGDSIVVEGDVW